MVTASEIIVTVGVSVTAVVSFPAALVRSVTSDGFQMMVSGPAARPLPDFQFTNLQGHLPGYGVEEQSPTIAIAAHYDAIAVAPVDVAVSLFGWMSEMEDTLSDCLPICVHYSIIAYSIHSYYSLSQHANCLYAVACCGHLIVGVFNCVFRDILHY